MKYKDIQRHMTCQKVGARQPSDQNKWIWKTRIVYTATEIVTVWSASSNHKSHFIGYRSELACKANVTTKKDCKQLLHVPHGWENGDWKNRKTTWGCTDITHNTECLPATSRHTSHVNWFWTTETTCKGSCQNETLNKDKTSETFLFNGVNYWVHSENATDGMKQQIITCLVKTRECCFSSPPNKVLDAQITSVVVRGWWVRANKTWSEHANIHQKHCNQSKMLPSPLTKHTTLVPLILDHWNNL